MNNIYLNKLRESNLKLTPKRIAIIDFFLSKDQYLTPMSVWKGLKGEFKSLGLPSIYRNLELFEKCGILAKIQKPDRKLYYGLCNSKNKHHHHIICIECGKVEVFYDCNLSMKKNINGFIIISHSLQIEGVCPQCRLNN
ncbi:MAG: Fur family transcriptional regulator [Spirochaetota bacterium]|nr:Fur family transcriptional regulator [Spirochaetota bacterium]